LNDPPREPNYEASFYPFAVDDGDAPDERVKQCEAIKRVLRQGGSEVRCFVPRIHGEPGMWALVAAEAQSPGAFAEWQLVYSAPGRVMARLPWKRASTVEDPAIAGGGEPTIPDAIALVDYDADGASELVTLRSLATPSGESIPITEVWTARMSQVAAFGDTGKRRLIGILDQNKDGRPELLEDPYAVPWGSHGGVLGPKINWAQLLEVDEQGRVIADSAAARKFAAEQCATAKQALDGIRHGDAPCVAANVHCAVLWGVQPNATEAAINARCSDGSEDVGWCELSKNSWIRMARSAPPFVLGGAPAGKAGL
jgi:hypothetical protein